MSLLASNTTVLSPGIIQTSFGGNVWYREFIEELNSIGNWAQDKVYNPQQPGFIDEEIRISKSIYLDGECKSLKVYDDKLLNLFTLGVIEYIKYHQRLKINGDEGYRVLKYEKNGFYANHVDAASGGRRLSGLFYLNDDCEGGETAFPLHNLAVKPRAGDMLIFSCDHVFEHESKKVTKGEKYAVYTFFTYDQELIK